MSRLPIAIAWSDFQSVAVSTLSGAVTGAGQSANTCKHVDINIRMAKYEFVKLVLFPSAERGNPIGRRDIPRQMPTSNEEFGPFSALLVRTHTHTHTHVRDRIFLFLNSSRPFYICPTIQLLACGEILTIRQPKQADSRNAVYFAFFPPDTHAGDRAHGHFGP